MAARGRRLAPRFARRGPGILAPTIDTAVASSWISSSCIPASVVRADARPAPGGALLPLLACARRVSRSGLDRVDLKELHRPRRTPCGGVGHVLRHRLVRRVDAQRGRGFRPTGRVRVGLGVDEPHRRSGPSAARQGHQGRIVVRGAGGRGADLARPSGRIGTGASGCWPARWSCSPRPCCRSVGLPLGPVIGGLLLDHFW